MSLGEIMSPTGAGGGGWEAQGGVAISAQTAAPLLCVEHPEDGWMCYTENVNVIFNEIIFY